MEWNEIKSDRKNLRRGWCWLRFYRTIQYYVINTQHTYMYGKTPAEASAYYACACRYNIIHDAVPTRSTFRGLPTTTRTASSLCHVWSWLSIFPVVTRRKGSQPFQHDNNVDNGTHLRMVQVSWFLWSLFSFSLSFLFSSPRPSCGYYLQIIIIIRIVYICISSFSFLWLSAMLTCMS